MSKELLAGIQMKCRKDKPGAGDPGKVQSYCPTVQWWGYKKNQGWRQVEACVGCEGQQERILCENKEQMRDQGKHEPAAE